MAIKFGTSGVRGLVNEFTPAEVWKYVSAFLKHWELISPAGAWAPSDGDESPEKRPKVFLAMDRRESSPSIAIMVMRALEQNGYEYEYHGQVPTPCLANYSVSQKGLGIVITGSHVPADRNGIKFYLPTGETLKADEASIETLASQSLQKYQEGKVEGGPNDEWLIRAHEILAHPRGEAEEAYVARYLDFFREVDFVGTKVLVYEHSAVGSSVICRTLEKLGCTVIRRGFSSTFVPVDTENLENLAMLKQWALEARADFLVSTDGDSDRPLILDNKGEVLRGDQIGMLLGEYLGVECLAVPVSTLSSVLSLPYLKSVELTRIGSPYVIEGMRQLKANHPNCVVAGFEANGGFLIETPISKGDQELGALETRDAMIPILGIIAFCRQERLCLAELRQKLPTRYSYSGLIKPVEGAIATSLLDEASLRPDVFTNTFLPFIGSPLQELNTLDGARFTFRNEDVVHFRQSGNAPEFRCYTESRDALRAEEINRKALAAIASAAQR